MDRRAAERLARAHGPPLTARRIAWTEEAARRIGMAPATLRVHLHRAGLKLGATSRLETISLALRSKLIRAPAGHESRTRHESLPE